MKRYKVTILFFVCSLFSCKKTVILSLPTEAPQLFIQGVITDDSGPYTVMINRSVDFYADNDFPPVSGAAVSINDGAGVTDTLTESSPGVYSTHTIQGTPGNTYTLSVTVNDTTYTAVSTMPQPVVPDDITFSIITGLGVARISPTIYFQDPPDIKNYYRFEETIDGTPFTREVFVFDDRLSDGKQVSLDLQMDSAWLHPNNLVQITVDCIDRNVYNYFNQLSQSNGSAAFNAAASPGNPVSNISNGAYGYFSAETQRAMTANIP